MALQELWFGIIAVLFLGFFILEGFDFGVGMLMAPFGRVGTGDPEKHRRAALNRPVRTLVVIEANSAPKPAEYARPEANSVSALIVFAY